MQIQFHYDSGHHQHHYQSPQCWSFQTYTGCMLVRLSEKENGKNIFNFENKHFPILDNVQPATEEVTPPQTAIGNSVPILPRKMAQLKHYLCVSTYHNEQWKV